MRKLIMQIVAPALVGFLAFGCAQETAVTCGPGTVIDNSANQCLPIPDFNIIVDDFQLGQFAMTKVDVPERLDVGTPIVRSFTIKNAGTEGRDVVVVRFGISPVKQKIEELRDLLDEVDSDSVLDVTYVGQVILDDLAAGETRDVSYEIWVPGTVEDGLYGFFFAVDEVPLVRTEDGQYALDITAPGIAKSENKVRLGEAPLVHAPATVIVGKPDKPNLRILSATLDNSSFELDRSENLEEAMFTLSGRVSSQGLDLTEGFTATFELELPGHIIDVKGQDLGQGAFDSEEEYEGAPETTTYKYDPSRTFPLLIRRTEGTQPNMEYGQRCVTDLVYDEETDQENEVENCAVIFQEEGIDDVYKLYLTPDAIRLLEATQANKALNPGLDENNEIKGNLLFKVATAQEEYQNNLGDNVKSMPVVFMAPLAAREAGTADTDDAGVGEVQTSFGSNGPYPFVLRDHVQQQSFGNDWFGANYRFETRSNYNKHLDTTISQYKHVNHRFGGRFLKQNIDLLSATGTSDWGADKTVSKWKGEARVTVLGFTLINATFNPSFCQTAEKITSCPIFDAVVEESQRKNASAKAKPKKYSYFKGRKWEYRIQAGPVPLLVTAEAGLWLNSKVVGHFIIDNRGPVTKYGVQFAAGPEVSVGITVFGGVSIAVARAGIEGSLQLASVDFLPFLRPLAGVLWDSAKGCFRSAETSIEFEGPLTVKGPNGSISVVAYAGIRICFFKCWRIEAKVFSLTIASFSSWENTWNLWSLKTTWQRRPGQWGMCADAITPPAIEHWRSPTSCSNGYCANSSTNRAGNGTHNPNNVLAAYKRTYTMQGTTANCVDVTVRGRTREQLDRVVIYGANNQPVNSETVWHRVLWFNIAVGWQHGWSGNIDKTVRVCGASATATLESGTNVSGQPGVTVTFTPQM